MKIKNILIIIFIAVAVGGCATVGNEKIATQSQTSIAQIIIEGKTTKHDVQSALGDATTVSFTDSGNEIWTYKHTRATPQGRNFIPIVNLFSRGADVTRAMLKIGV